LTTPPAQADLDSSLRPVLDLITGAWTTQAIHVAARLRLADHLADGAKGSAELAGLTDTDHDSLLRLLRYLVGLGLLTESDDAFGLSAAGEQLRSDVLGSVHHLALLYGGLYYRSFGALEHAVRTGESSFQHVFGSDTFAYYAEHPEAATIFNQAMAFAAVSFEAVPDVVDFAETDVVVDVGGGVGELLGRILVAHPHLRGILVDLPAVVDAARARLREAGCLDRCDLVPGDFTREIPAGDGTYILSRVLHDHPDERCRLILRNCRASMGPSARLLVIERLLTDDRSLSLARRWDLNMLVNERGRERTQEEYERLLGDAGLELVERHALPLEMSVLSARPSRPTPPGA
jgi:hypothetical protein